MGGGGERWRGVDSRRGDGDTQRSGLMGRKAAAGWETRWVGVGGCAM